MEPNINPNLTHEYKKLGIPRAIAIVVAIAVAVAAYFYFAGKQSPAEVPVLDSGPDVSTEVSNAVETPAEKIPETNPFKGYKNPFE